MDLLFQCLFKKIERANQKLIGSLRKGRYYEKLREEIQELDSLLVELCHDIKNSYEYETSLEDSNDIKLNEEMKKAQLLLYAILITKLNLESYIKYFETKDESLLIRKNIMFLDEFDAQEGWISTTVKELMTNEKEAKLFYKPLGYCDAKVSMDDDVLSLKYTRDRDLINDFGIVDIEAKEYLKKWNRTFE
ncbi:hypothetical protein HB839_13720 [Listeria sp. FSL L7-1699]|uniref:Uncharacterized protein n=1 Tax=Listeria farberi TaxID=2713500 RepID=A0ABR6SR50_9LIST|nr:hypothetical protein [Listeria farberi]MBC1376586.1 hypothetical protein [Listeria farberi]